MSRYDCDLHCHTVRSDGNDTPRELIDNAAKIGMKVIAITDHDIQPPSVVKVGNEEIPIKKYAFDKGIELVLGYEFSCDTYVDDVHILGYKLDWSNKLVEDEVRRERESKVDAYRKLCDVLTENGIHVDYENSILRYTDEEDNVRYRKPEDVQRKHIFEFIAKTGYAPSWKDAKIMVRDNPKLNVRRKKINPFDAIDLIKNCGGTVVLAHPFLIDDVVKYPDEKTLTRENYINQLIEHGLDGIEACYTYSKTSYKGSFSNKEIENYIKEHYGDRVKFFTGGSDYHDDGKKNVKNPRCIGEAGITYEEFNTIRDYFI
ncbi:PHP domain-containing protein [Clostridium sp. HV4-5-A1G]|uniref:PHP domain-containing protein n=1 Tax=Clostridium sp. HV4-5-A1G TaxID=2004595 RepID=UPI00123AD100|nr:PHP domain-containing protein [Clostridium sp. HV4-5-A1G]KAA8670816.1 PHP domain-containing protein [Clostridium sp. HV4-5-A1G]